MKKLKFLVGAVALFALVAVNVWNAATVMTSSSDLDVKDVENVAEGEDNPLNKWYQWLTQGITKDEREVKEIVPLTVKVHVDANGDAHLPNGEIVHIGGNYNKDVTTTYNCVQISCVYGYDNCTRKRCI